MREEWKAERGELKKIQPEPGESRESERNCRPSGALPPAADTSSTREVWQRSKRSGQLSERKRLQPLRATRAA